MIPVPYVTVGDVPQPFPEAMTVLDVREDVEWQHGRIAESVHIPLHDLPQRVGELPEGGQLLVVCKVGGRSAQAVAWLQRQGIDAVNLDGGLLEWAEAGRPMVSDEGEPVVV